MLPTTRKWLFHDLSRGLVSFVKDFLRNFIVKCYQHSDLSFVHPSFSVWCPILVMSPLRWIYPKSSITASLCWNLSISYPDFCNKHSEISFNSDSTTKNPCSILIISWLICCKSCFFSVIQLLTNPAVIPESKVIQVVLVAQSCPILYDPIDYSPNRLLCSGKNTEVGCHFLLQGIFLPRDWIWVSCITGRFFAIWATREVWVVRSLCNQFHFPYSISILLFHLINHKDLIILCLNFCSLNIHSLKCRHDLERYTTS